jgi:hypothetical protein
VAELADLWLFHQKAPFPASCLSLSVRGVPLVKIDAAAGALLTASLRTDGRVRRLDDRKLKDLRSSRELVLEALQNLPLDAEGRAYFERLSVLAAGVLKE